MVSGRSFLLTFKSHVVGVIHQRAARVGQLNINFWIRLNLLSRAVFEPYLLYKPWLFSQLLGYTRQIIYVQAK